MAAGSTGQNPGVFDIKSASLTLVAVVLKTTDLAALADELQQRLGATPDVFDQEPVVIDLAHVASEPAPVDFAGLVQLLRRHRMLPIAVRAGNAEQMLAAQEAGLTEAEAGAAPRGETKEVIKEVVREVQVQVPVEVRVEVPVATTTLIVDKPVRSGQQVYAKGGDLIMLAAVNPGAEVIADGNIHVYAPLRGKAIAGAKGNTAARIFAQCLEPELVAIAGTYRTTENPLPPEVVGRAAQVRLDGERLVFEAIKL